MRFAAIDQFYEQPKYIQDAIPLAHKSSLFGKLSHFFFRNDLFENFQTYAELHGACRDFQGPFHPIRRAQVLAPSTCDRFQTNVLDFRNVSFKRFFNLRNSRLGSAVP